MKNILIIDDEEKLRGLLARIVKSEGFDILEACDLKSGFKKLEQNEIDVVLCDVDVYKRQLMHDELLLKRYLRGKSFDLK